MLGIIFSIMLSTGIENDPAWDHKEISKDFTAFYSYDGTGFWLHFVSEGTGAGFTERFEIFCEDEKIYNEGEGLRPLAWYAPGSFVDRGFKRYCEGGIDK